MVVCIYIDVAAALSGFVAPIIPDVTVTARRRFDFMAYYVHQIPGRMRVRIPEMRGDAACAREIERLLDVYGVGDAKASELTGSVVVRYDTDSVTHDRLLTILNHHGYYDDARVISYEDQVHKASHLAASKVGRAFFGWAVGKALERSGFGLLAALI
jgi:hypothetical protein